MSSDTLVKCACEACVCLVSLEDAVQKNDRYYCSQSCADGHSNREGCGKKECVCC